MSIQWIGPLIPVAASLILVLGLLRLVKWRRARRGDRPPFSDRLLRSPGHGLGKDIWDISDDITAYTVMVFVIPLLLYAAYVGIESGVSAKRDPLWYWILGGALMLWSLWKTWTLIGRRRLLRIGMAGEIATGEELNRLMLDGYRVYHDFPADRFNIDHIVVGPFGILAVETKARSKGSRRNGKAEAAVAYDGERLRFPSAVTSDPIKQARAQAAWLSKWLSNAVGESVKVTPAVVLPGWYIERKSPNGVPVLNPKEVGRYLKARKEQVLSESMITRVCHQLEQKCRDVDLWDWY